MSRPKRRRVVAIPPAIEGFRPFGAATTHKEPMELLFEEYESIRLVDYEGLIHEQAAERMSISRPTFTRIYENARKIVAKALVEGRAIILRGGDFHADEHWYRCEDCDRVIVSKDKIQSCKYCNSEKLYDLTTICAERDCEDSVCVCIECSTEMAHVKGKPCNEYQCPKCGSRMMRKTCYHYHLYLKCQDKK